MSTVVSSERLLIPTSLKNLLEKFKLRVWTTKMLEVVSLAGATIILAFLALFLLDRLVDTHVGVRWMGLGAIAIVLAMIPFTFHRWVWGHRKLDQVARLLQRRDPAFGDQLLGVIELSENGDEQARSRTLCEAAMQQVAEAAARKDLLASAPPTKHRGFAILALITAVVALILLAVVPQASLNAWARLIAPWRDIPRYTFATVSHLPTRLVVPHGEAFPWRLELSPESRWRPSQATMILANRTTKSAALQSDRNYDLMLPAMTNTQFVDLRIGDIRHRVIVEPLPRPELVAIQADVQLPAYLGIDAIQQRDARSGSVTVVAGSSVTAVASASRALASASVSGHRVDVEEARFTSPSLAIADSDQSFQLEWEDLHGLQGREPFALQLRSRPDEVPSVAVEGLAKQAVVLHSEQLNFSLFVGDDFGIRRVGLSWKGVDSRQLHELADGECILAAGGPEESALQLKATFVAADVGIEPQPIELRAWVEDYFPERGRQYSAPHLLYVLSAEQHAIWITEQLSKWHRQSLDVRDRELQLHEANKQLRELPDELWAETDIQKRLEEQASAEASNGRRLSQLTRVGEDLIRQAARNPEIGVAHLDKWAEMLQVLKDISGNRMPTVEELLRKAATTANSNPNASKQQAASGVGKIRDLASKGGPSNPTEDNPPKPTIPGLVDRESSQQPIEAKDAKGGTNSKTGQGRLTLPTTTLAGPPQEPPPPSEQPAPMDEAVREQAELLAEFEKIAEELNQILTNMEGSTLVKRLKAASREQLLVASKISDHVSETFGRSIRVPKETTELLRELSKAESKSVQTVSHIMDDLSAYFARRRANKFKLVLDDMRELDVLGGIRALSDDIPKEQGMSIAQCEFWSDTLDRWAEDLVDPACKGCCPGGKSKDSLPPSIILELLQILEAEVNLREETRVAEQAKSAQSDEEFANAADKIAEKQEQLQVRIQKVVARIRELPDYEQHFDRELQILEAVDGVMGEAVAILASPNTGSAAIAAETEAIELLLQSRRINPRSGGGGGNSPGGGGRGNTTDSALALIGKGTNEHEFREHRAPQQATGDSGLRLPEEFRSGLDEYFNRLDSETR